jgi:demethylmenaquinone methyltransferase/2-methoxy-6-polyprenyl-1,4-benzoquinol methylase
VSELLEEMREYYAARAPEYEDWWYRRGPFQLDPERKARWDADIHEVERALDDVLGGTVVELAAGTGTWTRKLVAGADRVVAVDASPETLALNTPQAEHVVADLFDWRPAERFDLCFFGFWLSHVPDERLDEFWALVRAALKPGGRVFLIDSGAGDPVHATLSHSGVETRRLQDGREFRIVKRYRTPADFPELDLRVTANGHFLYGGGVP